MKGKSKAMIRVRLLISEPDDTLRLAMVSAFEAAGFEVPGEATPQDAASRPPDIAILDLALHEHGHTPLKGIEFAQSLARSHTPFVFVTSHDDDDLMRCAIQTGAYGYFVKPIDPAVLVRSMPAWLARAEEMRRLRHEQRSLLDALADSRSIGTAVGVISERHRVSPEQAFDRLRRRARDERRPIGDVASNLLKGHDPWADNGKPGG